MRHTLGKFLRHISRRTAKMFNLYQHMKNNNEGKETKESETTGHDRFYQERPRTSYRKKKRRGACRRAQSAAELNPESIAAANKRDAFRIRSVSTDRDESEEENSERAPLVAQKIDSLAKLLFNKSIIGTGSGKSSPSEPPASPKIEAQGQSIPTPYRQQQPDRDRQCDAEPDRTRQCQAEPERNRQFQKELDSALQCQAEPERNRQCQKELDLARQCQAELDSTRQCQTDSDRIRQRCPHRSRRRAWKVGERSMESSAALAICSEYLSMTSRYDLISQLCAIGSRPNKHWFAIHDNSIKTDRLLTLMPLTSKCPIEPNDRSQTLIMELFRALHHPYIYPVLDLELRNGHALAVLPFNARGSLKDLIYKSTWNEEYSRKYGADGCGGGGAGAGLPAGQVARFGRQILEGLLFLKDKGFPPFRHLHAGNVMVQNGVARICGLENTLVGAAARPALALPPAAAAEAWALARLLYEMCAARELDAMLLCDLTANYPHVVDIIEQILGPRPPALHELLLCELFRKIDLREMKGSCLPNFSQRLSRSCLSLLSEVRHGAGSSGGAGAGALSPRARTPPRRYASPGPTTPATPPSRRRHFPIEQDFTEEWQW